MLSIEQSKDTLEDSLQQLFLALSHDARMGSNGHRTIRFHGIQGIPIVILLDSWSSSSFLVASIANQNKDPK